MFAIHELTILTITQQEVGVLAGVLNILAKYSAKIDKITFEGTKHLAYKIKDHNYGGFMKIFEKLNKKFYKEPIEAKVENEI